jgi:hypothetical protein
MQAKLASVTALACLLGVAACADRDDGDRGRRASVAGICTPFAGAGAATTDISGVGAAPGGGDAAAFDDCLHRWGYRLARSEDPAGDVAQAVVAACGPALSRWNQSSLTQVPAGPDTAVSLITGEASTTIGERYSLAQSKALFYVVQARAGNCAPPPETATTTPAPR